MSTKNNSGVVIGGKKNSFHVGPRARVALLVTGVAICVFALAAGGYVIYHKYAKPAETPAQVLKKQKSAAYSGYSELINAREYDEARAYVNTKMASISEAERKAMLKDIDTLSTDRSGLLAEYAAKDKAGTLDWSEASGAGDFYVMRGDKTNAKVYYEKALILLDKSSSPVKEGEASTIQRKLDALK